MRKGIKRSLAAVILLTAALQPEVFGQKIERTFEIDPDVTVAQATKDLYGTNLEWGFEAQIEDIGAGAYDMEEKAKQMAEDLKGLKVNFFREAGGASTGWQWKDSIGPPEGRKRYNIYTQLNYRFTNDNRVHYTNPRGNTFGLVEWLKTCLAIDPECRFNIVLNFGTETTENISDLIRFMTLTPEDPKAIGTDGINWARKRVDLGFEEPFKDVVWTLGNELDLDGRTNGFYSTEMYVRRAKEIIYVIREIQPDAVIATQANYASTVPDWYRAALCEYGDMIDYVDFHTYGIDTPGGAQGIVSAVENFKNDLISITSSDRIKVLISEYGMGNVPEARAMKGAIRAGEFYNRLLPSGMLALANNYAFGAIRTSASMGANWASTYIDNDGHWYATPVGWVLDLYARYGIGDVLDCTLSDYDRFVNSDLTALAFRNGDNINVIATNASDADDYELDIILSGYHAKETVEMKGASLKSSNETGKKEVTKTTMPLNGTEDHFNISKASVKIIVFEKDS